MSLGAGIPSQESSWVPDAWIQSARNLNKPEGDGVEGLVVAFSNEHPNLALMSASSGEARSPYLDLSWADLDGDGSPEAILFIGAYGEADTTLYLLHREGARWRILHHEDVYMRNNPPRFEVLRDEEGAGVFVLTHLYEQGPGNLLRSHRFYRMDRGKVRMALETVEESAYALPTSSVAGQAESQNIRVEHGDILLTYQYEFDAGSLLLDAIGLREDESISRIPLLTGEVPVRYRWDPHAGIYRLDSQVLDLPKTRCFFRFWDDRAFSRAFRKELILAEKTAVGFRKAALRSVLGLRPRP